MLVSSKLEKMEQNFEKTQDRKSKLAAWLKRIGVAGFLFFLIKGLVWIGIFIWAGRCAVSD
jgi:hypothetical protein